MPSVADKRETARLMQELQSAGEMDMETLADAFAPRGKATPSPATSPEIDLDALADAFAPRPAAPVTPPAVAPGAAVPPVLPPTGAAPVLPSSAPGVTPPRPSPPAPAAALRPPAAAAPAPPPARAAAAAAVPSPLFLKAVERMREDTQSILGKVRKPADRRGGGIPISHPLSQGQMGVILGSLAPPGGNPWEAYNQRRLRDCIDCHQSEMPPEARPAREVPLGKPGPGKVIVGSRANAYWGTPDEALRYYDEVRRFLTQPENREANPAWRKDVAALDRARSELAKASPPSTAAAAVPKTVQLSVPKNVAPVKFPKGAAELAFYQAQEDRKRVPAYLTAPGREPGAPVQEMQAREQFALAKWYHQERHRTVAALNAEGKRLETEARAIERDFQSGKQIPNARLANFEAKRRGLEARNQEVAGLSQRYAQEAKSGGAIHSGLYYPEEVAAGQPGFLERAMKTTGRFVAPAATAALEQVPAILNRLQWEGRFEPLPAIPYKDRQRGIKEAQGVRRYLQQEQATAFRDDRHRKMWERDAVKGWTPFQREKLLPVMRRQFQARQDAEDIAKVKQATGIDVLSQLASMGAGAGIGAVLRHPAVKEAVKQVAPRLFVRYAAATAPTLAAEFEPLSRAALNRIMIRAVPHVTAGAGAGATASGITAGGITQLQGGDVGESVRAGLREAPMGALTGAATAGILSVLEGGLRSGWNPKTSPRLIDRYVADAQARGLGVDRVPQLREALTRAAQAPAAAKSRLIRGIAQEFGPEIGYQPPAPKARPAARPKAGRGDYIPPEQPQATPRAQGPKARTSTGEEIALRGTPRETLEQVAQSGDPQAAPAAQAWLDRHEAYEMQQNPPPPAGMAREYGNAWLKSAEKKQHDAMVAVAAQNPDLAPAMQEAAETLRLGWHHGFVRTNAPENVIEPAVGPPMVSVWRRLTPEQQSALPEPVRRVLLQQDLANSLQVLAPEEPLPTSLAEMRDRGFGFRSAGDLARRADEAFEAAQQAAEHGFVSPVAEPLALGPGEAIPSELPAKPGELPAEVLGEPNLIPPVQPQEMPATVPEAALTTETPLVPQTSAGDALAVPERRLYRFDEEGAGPDATKPHGAYYSLLEQAEDSPHQDVGPKRTEARPAAKNPLEVEEPEIEHARFGRSRSGRVSAGVAALRKLVDATEFERLRKASKAQLTGELSRRFPGPDYGRYHDSYELLEAYGAQLAREQGHDAIVQRDTRFRASEREFGAKDFSEYVALTPESAATAPEALPATGEAAAPEAGAGGAVGAPEAVPYVGPERRAAAVDVEIEQRTNRALRQAVEELTPEEKDQVIHDLRNRVLVDPATGLGTWADYLSRPSDGPQAHKPAQASIDVDGLGWVNTHFGHEGGDALIAKVGETFREIGLTGDTWHKSGDEFAAQAMSREALEEVLALAQERLANSPTTFTTPDGQIRTFQGIRLSYVTDETYQAADKRLESVKEQARAAGLRAPKGERPPGLVELGAGGGGAEGRPGGDSGPAGRVAEGVAEAARGGQGEARAKVAPRAEGTDTTFKAGGETHAARWAVYEASDLVTSHTDDLTENPAYPKELQPRDRGRQASREQVAEIAQKLDPALMGQNPLAQHGAPIVGPDGVLESGNGRTIALRTLYGRKDARAKAYQQWLAKNAGDFGLNPADLKGIQQPVLVRVRTSELTAEQRVAFTRTANARETAAMGAVEQARTDAERLTPKLMSQFDPGEAGDIAAATNRPFVRAFIESLPTSEQGSLRTAEGTVSSEGMRRIRNAVFQFVYGDADALTRLAEAVDDPVRNITNGMLRAAGHLTDLQRRIDSETAYPVNVAEDVAKAAAKVAVLREQGQSVTGYLAQIGMFGEDLTPLQRNILVHLDTNKRSAKKIAATLADYVDLATKAGDPGSGTLFEDIAPPEKQTLWQAAVDRTQRIADDEPGLFPPETTREGTSQAEAGAAAPVRATDEATGGAKAAKATRPRTEEVTPAAKPKPAPRKKPKETAATPARKEPWQMTAREWERAREAVRPETFGSAPQKASAGQAVARITELERLLYGVEKPVESVGYFPSRPKVFHRDVIEKALSEGKPVPPEVLADYPDLRESGAKGGEVQQQPQIQQRQGVPPWLQHIGKKGAVEARAKDLARKFRLEQRRRARQRQATEARVGQIGRAGAAEKQRQAMLPVLRPEIPFPTRIPPVGETGARGFRRGGGKPPPPPIPPGPPALPGAAEPPTPRALPGPREFGQYSDPVTNRLMTDNRGVDTQPSFRERLTDRFGRLARIATREFEELPNDPELYEFRDRLRQVARAGRDIARDSAVFRLAWALDDLNPKETQVAGDSLYLHGMEEDIENQLAAHIERGGTRLNFEPLLPIDPRTGEAWTPERLAQALLENEADVLSSPKVQDAITRLYIVRNEVWDPYWDVSEAVLGKTRPEAKRAYFRHKIVAYRNAAALAQGGFLGPRAKRIATSATNFGFLKKRTGSTLMYDTDLITAEMDWMPHMVLGRMKLDLLRHVQDRMDLSRRLWLEAIDLNDDLFMPYLDELDRVFGKEIPKDGEQAAFRDRQRVAVKLTRLASEGHLPDHPSGRYRPLLDALAGNHQFNVDREANGFTQRVGLAGDILDQIPGYVTWLREPGSATGVMPRHNAKSRAERRRQLGKEFVEPEDLIPEGYTAWFGAPGTVLHDAWSAPEQLQAAIVQAGAEEMGIPAEAVKRLESAVTSRRPLIIREEAATVLNRIMDRDPDSPEQFVARSLQWLLGQWKATKIVFPTRAISYYLHNGVGDLTNFVRATGGDPRAFRSYVASSNRMLRKVFRGQAPDPIVQTYFEQGAQANIQTTAEGIGTGTGVDILGRYTQRRVHPARRAWNVVKNRLRAPHDLREHTLRLGLFRYYYDHIQQHGVPPNYGASDEAEIEALPTTERKAWNLANDAMVSYDRTTEGGRLMASYVYPFWRWKEGNARVQFGFARNAVMGADARAQAAAGRKLAGKPLPFVWSIQLARAAFLAANGMLWAAAWNKWGPFRREDEQMPAEVRHRPHFTFVDPVSGKTLTFDRFDPLADFASNFGMDNTGGYLESVNNGWMSPTEAVRDMGKTAASNFLNGLGPQWQFLVKASGQSLFPNVFEPRAVMDQTETLFDEFGLGWAWRSYLGHPQKRNTWTKMMLGTNVVDANEGAYYEMRDRADDWMRKAGKPRDKGGSKSLTPLSSSAYWFRQARRYGDTMSAALNLLKFQTAGGEDQVMINSLKKMEPLSGLPPTEREKFLAQIQPEDAERLRRAYYHWQSLAAPEFDVSRIDTTDIGEFVRQMRANLSGMGNAPGAIDTYVQRLAEEHRRQHPELDEVRRKRMEQEILERVMRKAGG